MVFLGTRLCKCLLIRIEAVIKRNCRRDNGVTLKTNGTVKSTVQMCISSIDGSSVEH